MMGDDRSTVPPWDSRDREPSEDALMDAMYGRPRTECVVCGDELPIHMDVAVCPDGCLE